MRFLKEREDAIKNRLQIDLSTDASVNTDTVTLTNDKVYQYVTGRIRSDYHIYVASIPLMLERLVDGVWLSDLVIDTYFSRILQTIANLNVNLTVFVVGKEFTDDIVNTSKRTRLNDTELVDSIKANQNHPIQRFISSICSAETRVIVTYAHLNDKSHWVTIAIDLYNKKIHFLDPMKKGKYPVATTIVTRLLMVLCELEVIRQKFSELDPSWRDYVVVQEKLQDNGYDCGIFVLLFGELFARQIIKESYDMYPKY